MGRKSTYLHDSTGRDRTHSFQLIRQVPTGTTVEDPDPYVFGLPKSGSFFHQAKIERKTLIPTVL